LALDEQLVQQLARRRGDLVDRAVERVLVARRGFSVARDLPDELQRRLVHLLVGRGDLLGVSQRLDAPAHGQDHNPSKGSALSYSVRSMSASADAMSSGVTACGARQ